MKNRAFLFILVVGVLFCLSAAAAGAEWPVEVLCDSTSHPAWEGKSVYCFRPAADTARLPVILFCHGITAQEPTAYSALISHMVGRGFVVVFVPYGTPSAMLAPRVAYHALWLGFEKAMNEWNEHINSSRLGVVGHSYGGAAAPWVGWKAFREKRWGRESAFIFAMAPWYVHGLSQWKLKHFPCHVKLAVLVYEDDTVNDHRMGKDMYRTMRIALSEKAFVSAGSDYTGPHPLIADHDVPTGSFQDVRCVEKLERLGVFALFDAVSMCALKSHSWKTASEHTDNLHSSKQWDAVYALPALRHESAPRMVRTQAFCVNFWHHAMNPRTRFYRRLREPARMVLHTPVTLWNYCLLVGQQLDR